ncbi:MAG: hypothetical protein ACRED6_06800 [Stellaceae bacterium]
MASQAKVIAATSARLAGVGLVIWFLFVAWRGAWHALAQVNPNLGVALVAAAATLLAATITVMLGRYYERKRDIEAHFRSEKIKIYDDFLREFFKVLTGEDVANPKLVDFLREWQRRLVIWGGPEVLKAYYVWFGRMKLGGQPDVQSLMEMDKFFRALRSDIGQSSWGLPNGIFVTMIMRHGEFLLEQAKKNPKITLAEVAKLEEQHFGKN